MELAERNAISIKGTESSVQKLSHAPRNFKRGLSRNGRSAAEIGPGDQMWPNATGGGTNDGRSGPTMAATIGPGDHLWHERLP